MDWRAYSETGARPNVVSQQAAVIPQLRDHGVLFGRRHIDRLESEGKRVPMGAKRVGWVAAEVEGWVSAAIARRSGNMAGQAVSESAA